MTPRPRIREDLLERLGLRKFRLLVRPRGTALRTHRGGKRRNVCAILRQLDRPVLRRLVGLDQANVEIEDALRDRRAKIDGQRQRIAGPLRVIDQCPQDGGGGCSAERADEGPVIVAGLSSPAAVTGGNPRGVVEKVLGFGKHFHSFRHCEPTGRANARPMTGSAKQSRSNEASLDCFVAPLLAMTLWLFCSQHRGNSVEFNDAGGNGFPLTGQRVPPRCAPASCKARGRVPGTGTFQISWAYSRMVRSVENHGIRATLRIEARVHPGITCQRASIPRWASK